MPFIVKTDPFDAAAGEGVLEERCYFGGDAVARGDEIFVWLSEASGGSGLCWQGHVCGVEPLDGRMRLSVRLTNRVVSARLGVSSLEPFRDTHDDTPAAALAHKLYRHAHNKIANSTHAEGEFLRESFRRNDRV